MAQINAKITFDLLVTSSELTLIMKALRGEVTCADEAAAAQGLARSLANMRVGTTKSILNSIEKLEANLKKAEVPS